MCVFCSCLPSSHDLVLVCLCRLVFFSKFESRRARRLAPRSFSCARNERGSRLRHVALAPWASLFWPYVGGNVRAWQDASICQFQCFFSPRLRHTLWAAKNGLKSQHATLENMEPPGRQQAVVWAPHSATLRLASDQNPPFPRYHESRRAVSKRYTHSHSHHASIFLSPLRKIVLKRHV